MKTIEFQLSQNINLEMVKIPDGSFLMGSSADETVFRENETPQHEVHFSSFRVGDIAHNTDNIVGLRVCMDK